MAQVLHIDGRVSEVAPPANGVGYTLEEVKDALGIGRDRFIQQIPLGGSTVMLFDEEGKLVGLPVNDGATRFAYEVLFPGDYIVGPAMVVQLRDGEWTP
jgi:hypothetical protein